jgi:hypothetical protein
MKRVGRRLVAPSWIAVVASLLLAACGGGDDDEPSEGVVVSARATDFAFEAPESVLSGRVTLRLSNDGDEDHELHLLRLNDGVAIHQFQQTLHQDGLDAALRLGEVRGHVATVPPGETSGAAVDLPEGEYVLICQLPSPDGVAHALKGMARPLTVAASP